MNSNTKFETNALTRAICLTITLIVLLSIVTACASKKGIVDIKMPIPIWQVLQHREPGAGWAEHEDNQFKYFAGLVYDVSGKSLISERFVPLCPLKEVKFTITDKKNAEIVKSEILTTDKNCTSCHPKQ